MRLPLQITFRNMDASEAVEARIREKAGKLDRFADEITACRVVVERPHKHANKGNLYQVQVDLSVPDGELVASSHASPEHRENEDVYVAVRDAFAAAQRRVEAYVTKRRGQIKTPTRAS